MKVFLLIGCFSSLVLPTLQEFKPTLVSKVPFPELSYLIHLRK